MPDFKRLADYLSEPGNLFSSKLQEVVGQNASASMISRQTRTLLNGVTPSNEAATGLVLNDPDPALNGYYYRAAGAWVKGRGFADELGRYTVTGGTANAITATLTASVDPATVLVFFIRPSSTNTGAVTINGKSLRNIAGAVLTAGELVAGRTYFFTDEGSTFQMVFGADLVPLVNQAISMRDQAAASASAAQTAADNAEELEANLDIWVGSQAEYDAINPKNPARIYFVY